jgi:TP901 family phage tail tape measure protein
MAESQRIEGVYEIRLEHAGAVRGAQAAIAAFKALNKEAKGVSKEFLDLIKLADRLDISFKGSGSTPRAPRAPIAAQEAQPQAPKINTVDIEAATKRTAELREESKKLFDQYKQGGSSEQVFTDINSALIDTRSELTQNNAAIKANAKEQRELQAIVKASGAATEEQAHDIDRLTKEREELKTVNASLKISEGQLSSVFREVGNDVKGLTENQLRFRDKMAQSFSSQNLKAELSSMAMQYVGIGAAIYGAQQVLGDAIETVVEFNKALSGIKALGGEYAANIEAIGEAAKTAGIEFGFTATESLQAVEALAKAGVTTADILGGALPGALTLAAAGEVSVAEAAETASKAMTQFGLAGEDIPHLADLLAAAAATATGDVGDFNQALNQAGLVASQLNIPIEEAVGTLTAFASAGLLGSDAGTSFRTMLLRLQNPTEESAALLEKYNIDAFDLQGNFVGIESLAGQLQERLSGLTQEQRSAALAQIFGSDAIRAANVLYTQGAEGVAKFTEQVNQSGFAATVAAEKTNNLKGDVERLKAQYDAFIISVDNGDGVLSRAFRGIVQGFTRDLKLLASADGVGDLLKVFTPGLAQLEASKETLKEVGAELEKIKAASDPSKKSVEELEQQLLKLTSIRDAFTKQNKPEAAAEGDPQIAALERLIAARKKLAEIQSKGKEEKVSPDAAQYESVAAASAKLKEQLGQLKAERLSLNATDKEGIAAKDREIAAIEKKINALDGEKNAGRAAAQEAKNVAGSVADITAQISDLQQKQAQSTDSAQFAAYQKQIDALGDSIERITSAAASDTPLIDEVFGKNLEALPPERSDPGTGMIDDLEAEARRSLLKAEEDMRIASLSGARDYNAERLALQEQYNSSAEMSAEEHAARLAAINRAEDEADLTAAAGVANALQAISDASFDSKIAALDEQNATLQDRLAAAQDEQTKERIKGEIKAVEQEKKALQQRKESFKTFSIAAALIETFLAAQKAYTSQLIPGDPTSLPRAIAAAFTATAFGLLNVAKIQGLAEGGQVEEPSGRVTQSWGLPVTRDNGDDVLVRTRKGRVTLKTGEVVLNERQQQRLKRKAGKTIFGDIGVPGFRSGGRVPVPNSFLAELPSYYHTQGLIDGGTVGMISPRPSPTNIINMQQTQALQDYAQRPQYVSVREINDTQERVSVTENARTI